MRCRIGAAASSPPSVSHRVFAGAGHSPATESTGRESRPENEWQRAEGRRPAAGGGSGRHETRSPSPPPPAARPLAHSLLPTEAHRRRGTRLPRRGCRPCPRPRPLRAGPRIEYTGRELPEFPGKQDVSSAGSDLLQTKLQRDRGNITRNRAGMTFLGYRPAPGRARGAVLRRPTRQQASPSRLLIALRPRVRPCTTR